MYLPSTTTSTTVYYSSSTMSAPTSTEAENSSLAAQVLNGIETSTVQYEESYEMEEKGEEKVS